MIPKNKKCRRKLEIFIMRTRGLAVIGAWPFILHVEDTFTKAKLRTWQFCRIFENKIRQNFTAERPNQKWCTDFTYLFLKNHEVRYNCTIIDLYDQNVVSSITDRHITSDLAIRTLQKELDSQPVITGSIAD